MVAKAFSAAAETVCVSEKVDDEKPPAGQTVDVDHATLRTTRLELP